MASIPSGANFNPNDTLGAALLGGCTCAILYGITSLQTFYFFQHRTDQCVWVKVSVWFLWFINSLHLAFILHSLYWYMVTNYGNPSSVDELIWSIKAGLILTAFNDLLVRACLLYRIWILSARSRPVTFSMLVFVCAPFCIAIVMGVKAFETTTLASFLDNKWVVETDLAIVFLSDVLIATCLCILLVDHRRRAASRRTESYITLLIIYTVNTGLLTSVVALVCLITFLTMPYNYVSIAIFFPMAHLYANSLLATFNVRDTFVIGDAKHVALPLPALSPSRGSRSYSVSERDRSKDLVINIETQQSKMML